MVLVIAAHETGHHFALLVDDAVGDAKAQLAGIEIFDCLNVAG